MGVLLSLFDYTGAWSRPFEEAGWTVVQVDLKHGHDVHAFTARGLYADFQGYESIDGILAAPPCTDFACSGAAHFAAKDADGRTSASVRLVYQALRTVELFKPDFWALENPIGRLPRLVPELGARSLVFDPCDFAGYTDPSADDLDRLDSLRGVVERGERLSAESVELVKHVGAYTKRTVLWGRFKAPTPHRIEPVRCTAQGSWLQALGGSSERTKAERSVTPAGFARAFCEAQIGAAVQTAPELAMAA